MHFSSQQGFLCVCMQPQQPQLTRINHCHLKEFTRSCWPLAGKRAFDSAGRHRGDGWRPAGWTMSDRCSPTDTMGEVMQQMVMGEKKRGRVYFYSRIGGLRLELLLPKQNRDTGAQWRWQTEPGSSHTTSQNGMMGSCSDGKPTT